MKFWDYVALVTVPMSDIASRLYVWAIKLDHNVFQKQREQWGDK